MTNSTIYNNSSFQHILNTTEDIILEKGCRNTTLKDIIERTGLSKGAIYHYVESKDELFGLILKSKIEEMNEAFNQSIARSLHNENIGEETFEVISQFFYSRQNSKDVGNYIFVYLLSQDNEKVRNILKEIYKFSKETGAKWIKRGQENGVIPENIDAEKMAVLLMTFSFGLRVTQILSTTEEEKIAENDIFKMIISTLTHN
ncbi:TetR/AcrR family transcriptional regulator [Neobacillus endophyticus]|uniref:TetR/AcrR family transcriptional regulator n=1 Tax=Neobacillus endophyticus TaxID=2738405 RepID=UPI002483AE5C|nr:TetR/AcrR family transcriptional regulator [Neobacillus endophyticus]